MICMASLVAITLFAGCSQKESTVESSGETSAEETTAMETIAQPDSYGSVELGQYKGIEIAVEDTTVTDEEVEAEIQNNLANNPTYIDITDRAAVDGDTVNIDFAGTVDGEAFDGGTSEGYDLELGSGSFIDGFEDQIVGHKIGDEFDVNVTFPEDYGSEELNGKAAVFAVTLNSIKEKQEAVLDDAWVEEYTSGEQKTVAEYTAKVREDLEKQKKQNAEYSAQDSAINQLMESSTFTVNEDAVTYEYQQTVAYYNQYGMDMASVASMYGVTEDELAEEFKKSAEEIVKQKILMQAVYDAENMTITDEDYQSLADTYGSTVDDLVSTYGQETVDSAVKNTKVRTFLVDNAVKTAEETTAAETTAAETTAETAVAETTEAN